MKFKFHFFLKESRIFFNKAGIVGSFLGIIIVTIFAQLMNFCPLIVLHFLV